MAPAAKRISAVIGKADRSSRTGEVLWRVRTDDGGVDLTYGDQERQFFIASATKLYVTAILAQMQAEGKCSWDAPIAGFLPDLDLAGLLVIEGQDLTDSMRIRDVLAHTSGLADYFEGRRPDGSTTFQRAIARDFEWDVRDVVDWTKTLPPARPGQGRYSDTGFQLLGALIERVDGRTFAESVAERITTPLGMHRTYCFGVDTLDRYGEVAPMRYGDRDLRIPLAMASVQADGGIVSCLQDCLVFMDGFFGARLFPEQTLRDIQGDWHKIFPPLEYGTGIMRFRMNPLLSGLRRVPAFVGHSGASGTVMFRAPDLGLTVVGTVNQAKYRSTPYRLLVRTALLTMASQ